MNSSMPTGKRFPEQIALIILSAMSSIHALVLVLGSATLLIGHIVALQFDYAYWILIGVFFLWSLILVFSILFIVHGYNRRYSNSANSCATALVAIISILFVMVCADLYVTLNYEAFPQIYSSLTTFSPGAPTYVSGVLLISMSYIIIMEAFSISTLVLCRRIRKKSQHTDGEYHDIAYEMGKRIHQDRFKKVMIFIIIILVLNIMINQVFILSGSDARTLFFFI